MFSNDQTVSDSKLLAIRLWQSPYETWHAEAILGDEEHADTYMYRLWFTNNHICVKASYVQDKSSVVLFLPVEKIFQEVHEGWLSENALLRERMQIVWVCKALNKFKLKLKSCSVCCSRIFPQIWIRIWLRHGRQEARHIETVNLRPLPY